MVWVSDGAATYLGLLAVEVADRDAPRLARLAIARDGGTHKMVDRMQTRAELYQTIDYHAYESLDSTLIQTVVPEAMPQRS